MRWPWLLSLPIAASSPATRCFPSPALLESFARLMPECGGVCLNSASEMEGVNMALGAGRRRGPGRYRLLRPGRGPHAGGHRRGRPRRAAARHLHHGPGPAGLLPVHSRRWLGGLPHHHHGPQGRGRGGGAHPAALSSGRHVPGSGHPLRRLSDRRHPHERRRFQAGLRPSAPEGLGARRHDRRNRAQPSDLVLGHGQGQRPGSRP